jgi:hypothetical protein
MRTWLAVSLLGLLACGGPAIAPGPGPSVSNVVAEPPRPSHPDGEPAGFLFVADFDYGEDDQGNPTCSGRPHAISLNTSIPGHPELRAALAWRLDELGVVELVAVEPFGEDPPPFIEIHVGDRVPVAVTQAVLEVYGRQSGLPVRLGVSHVDQGFSETYRVYVGSLVHSVAEELTPAQLDALLEPGLDAARFYGMMPEVPERDPCGGAGGGIDP